jgi:succinate dehydrogenase / fumarate reductase, membrane anchor subunit
MASMARPAASRTLSPNRWGSFSWLFMRLSGLALILLVLGHFAIQHVLNDVHNLDINFVAARWAGLGWRIYDALMLSLGLVHGLNGVRIVVDDYVVNQTWNKVSRWVVWIVGGALAIVGAVAIIGGVR